MMINIQRERWIIVRDDGAVFCGLARNHKFETVDTIKNTAIKTYSSKEKAIYSFLRSWHGAIREDFEFGMYEAVKVMESIVEV